MRQLAAQERGALPGHLRMGEHRVDLLELERLGGDQRMPDPQQGLADDLHVARLPGEQVERHADRALERVLDRHDGPVHLARGAAP